MPSGLSRGVSAAFWEALGAIFGKRAAKRSSPTESVGAMDLLVDMFSICGRSRTLKTTYSHGISGKYRSFGQHRPPPSFFDVFAPPEGVFALPKGGGRGCFDVLGAPWAIRRAKGVRREGPVTVCATSVASTLDFKGAFGRPREPFGRFWGAFGTRMGRLGIFLGGLGEFHNLCQPLIPPPTKTSLKGKLW